jgi:hypothetical protein
MVKTESFEDFEDADNVQDPITEDEFVDLANIDALDDAMKSVVGKFPLTLPNGKKIQIPYRVMGFAYGLEASRGEKFKENEANDPEKTKRIYLKKMNMGLLGGWHIVDDIKRKLDKPSALLSKRQIPVSIITPRDWNLMNELMFPGALDQPETIQNRADAIRDESGPQVSETRDSDPGGN